MPRARAASGHPDLRRNLRPRVRRPSRGGGAGGRCASAVPGVGAATAVPGGLHDGAARPRLSRTSTAGVEVGAADHDWSSTMRARPLLTGLTAATLTAGITVAFPAVARPAHPHA